MACTRRSLATTFTHLSRGFHPSFTYVLHHDRDGNDAAAPPAPPPPPRSVPSFAGRGVGSHHPFLLDPFARRFYSSIAGGRSNETEFMSDGAEVLSDTSIETAIDAAASVPPAPFPGEVAAAAAGSVLPVAALQYLIGGVHSFSGLNWWASIAVTTVLIRGATIPLLLNTMRATAKLNKMRPDLEELKQQMQNSTDPESLQDGQKRMKALFAKHGVTPFTPLKGLLIQGPIFISFFLAISNMVEKVPSLKGGGAFWFTDLTTPDPSYMLPVLTSLTFLATVELNMQEGMEGNPMVHTMKNVSRGMALLTIPFTANFPKAIFCYWITSNLFSLTYGLAIKHPPVRKFLNLPDIVPQPTNPAPQPSFTLFGGSKSIIPTAPPSPANEPDQDTAPPSPSKEPGQGTPSRRIVSTASVNKHRIRNLEKAVKARSKPKKK